MDLYFFSVQLRLSCLDLTDFEYTSWPKKVVKQFAPLSTTSTDEDFFCILRSNGFYFSLSAPLPKHSTTVGSGVDIVVRVSAKAEKKVIDISSSSAEGNNSKNNRESHQSQYLNVVESEELALLVRPRINVAASVAFASVSRPPLGIVCHVCLAFFCSAVLSHKCHRDTVRHPQRVEFSCPM